MAGLLAARHRTAAGHGVTDCGHGTTIAWAPTFVEKFQLESAMEIGIAAATLGSRPVLAADQSPNS